MPEETVIAISIAVIFPTAMIIFTERRFDIFIFVLIAKLVSGVVVAIALEEGYHFLFAPILAVLYGFGAGWAWLSGRRRKRAIVELLETHARRMGFFE